MAGEKQLTKSKMISRLINQPKKEPKIDQQNLQKIIQLLENINREISGIGININQYQHQINKGMQDGYFNEEQARLLRSSWDMMAENEMKKKIDDLEKGLSQYVDY